jgi:MFS family permease
LSKYGPDGDGDAMMGNRWLILAALFLTRTVMGFQFQAVATLSPFLVAELGIDYTQLGLLIGFYLLPGIVIAYPGGLLGRRFGDKRIVILGLTLMVVGGVLTGIGYNYVTFLVGRLVSGTGAVLLNVHLTKMTTDWFVGREIKTALALLVSSWPIGIGIALVVLPWLAAAASVPTAFMTTAAAAAVAIVLIAAIYRAPASAAGTPPSVNGLDFGVSLREFGFVSLAGGVWVLFNAGYIILVSFVPSLLIAQGTSARDAGFATSLASWAAIITIALGGMLFDRIGHATALMIASLAVLGFSIMLIPGASSFALLAFVGIIAGLPTGAMIALPAEVLRPQSRGPGMGVFYSWSYVGNALLIPMAGYVRDLTSDPGAPVTFAGALEIAAIAVLILFRFFQHRYALRSEPNLDARGLP